MQESVSGIVRFCSNAAGVMMYFCQNGSYPLQQLWRLKIVWMEPKKFFDCFYCRLCSFKEGNGIDRVPAFMIIPRSISTVDSETRFTSYLPTSVGQESSEIKA